MLGKYFFGMFSSYIYIYSYIMIWYTRSCCHASKRTQPSIPHYNITIYVKRTYKTKQKKTTKNFQNLLTLKRSFSINILSKNTLHLHDSSLTPQKEHDPVSVKSILKVLLPIRNFKIIFTTFIHPTPYTLYFLHNFLFF